MHTHIYPCGQTLELIQGDLLAQRLDAIVNAANDRLAHGGGIAAAIAQRGGPLIEQESAAWIRRHGLVLYSAGDLAVFSDAWQQHYPA